MLSGFLNIHGNTCRSGRRCYIASHKDSPSSSGGTPRPENHGGDDGPLDPLPFDHQQQIFDTRAKFLTIIIDG